MITAKVEDKCYVPLLVKDFSEFVENETCSKNNNNDWVGFSVTIPHKESALKFCGRTLIQWRNRLGR